MKTNKEVYVFRFLDQARALFWFDEILRNHREDVVGSDKSQYSIEFEDSIFYLWSRSRVSKGLPKDTIEYDESALYIILDDPERFRIANPQFDKQTESFVKIVKRGED